MRGFVPSTLSALFALAAWAGGLLLVAVAPAQAQNRVGEVVFVLGSVSLDGQPVQKGASVHEGQQIQTGPGGHLYLRTVDKGFLVLREKTLAKLVTYRVDEANPANSAIKYELLEGVARHISGEAVRKAPGSFRFNTPVAAIGVRGTDFTVAADAQLMRVSVASGGIVVSGFGGGCSPGGFGPCESSNSRELFAGDANAVIQVRRGESTPELLRARELRPDANQPVRPEEPGRGGQSSGPAADPASNINGQKVASISVPLPPQLVWGRWQALAELPAAEAKLALASNGSYLPTSVVGPYFLTRAAQGDFSLPKDGVFGFRLTGGEAFLIGPGDKATAASIQNPVLEIDFAKRQFSTSLQVVTDASAVNIQARGDVTLQGQLLSDIVYSNATVRGYTSGGNASGAAYIFSRQVDNLTRAVGATQWTR